MPESIEVDIRKAMAGEREMERSDLITDSTIPHKAMQCGSRYCAQHRDIWWHYEHVISRPASRDRDDASVESKERNQYRRLG
jgi:hypothetical protein